MKVSSLTSLLAVSALADAWSPSNGYAPSRVNCEEDIQLVRKADGLSSNETQWLEKRDANTREALQSFLERATANFSDNALVSQLFDPSDDSNVPRIAVACSGGGYRAMLSGAGMLSAMDNRTEGANAHGLGGLLQSTTYLTGLSGGAWLVGSLAWNNWTSVQDIVDHTSEKGSIWDITNSLGQGGTNITATNQTWSDIMRAVTTKQMAGFNVTLADYWGRGLSYGFFPSLPEGGVGYTWSSLRSSDVFKNGEMPFPITVADFRKPYSEIAYGNTTIFEFNPFEMGSWDDSLQAFTDVKYLGTKAFNGTPVNKGQCVAGFDNTGFVLGTSSTLFTPSMSSAVGLLLNGGAVGEIFAKAMANDTNDVANYAPNPFKGVTFGSETEKYLTEDYLYLVDGGEDNEVIPFVTLLQQDRAMDVIFALDSSSDTAQAWPDGSALTTTYERQFTSQGDGIAFPHVPGPEIFELLPLNKQPTFFGCDAGNLTDLEYIPPLVVYIPNSPYSFNSNQSTLKLSYSGQERLSMIKNGFEITTRGNLTQDPGFAGCIACAIMRRQQENINATLPQECQECFANYCWTGEVTSSNMSLPDGSSSYNNTSSTHLTSTLSPSSSISQSSSASPTATISSSTNHNSANILRQTASYGKSIITLLCILMIVSISF